MTQEEKEEILALKARIFQLESEHPSTLKAAWKDLRNTTEDTFMASSVVVTISTCSGNRLAGPFACYDGLKKETMEALQREIEKTLDRQDVGKPATCGRNK